MRKSDFVLLDLDSQADAVAAHVEGLTPEQVIRWLERHGTVYKYGSDDDARFTYVSKLGLVGYFYFTPEGKFVIWRPGWLNY